MTGIKERAKAYAEERVNEMFCIPEEMPTEKQKANMMKGHEMTYIKIATEQEKIDYSEERLNWIIKEYRNYDYEMQHCDNNEQCSFKEWIDKAMEE